MYQSALHINVHYIYRGIIFIHFPFGTDVTTGSILRWVLKYFFCIFVYLNDVNSKILKCWNLIPSLLAHLLCFFVFVFIYVLLNNRSKWSLLWVSVHIHCQICERGYEVMIAILFYNCCFPFKSIIGSTHGFIHNSKDHMEKVLLVWLSFANITHKGVKNVSVLCSST